MAKESISLVCENCGFKVTKWLGCCPECGEWNTFAEENRLSLGSVEKFSTPSTKINLSSEEKLSLGSKELDKVFNGGITKGSLNLITGQPGVGKSTLILKIVKFLTDSYNIDILYISGEESLSQVAMRAHRTGTLSEKIRLLNETNWALIREEILKVTPNVIVLDSIQTTYIEDVGGTVGSVSQIKEVTFEMMELIKQKGITTFLVGHITKDGGLAGPKVLEHMVDSVFFFEKQRSGEKLFLRSQKNRFGNINEVGVFQMGENGLQDCGHELLKTKESSNNEIGNLFSCIKQGSRHFVVGIQSLVVKNNYSHGKRYVQGIDAKRLNMLLAILEKQLNMSLAEFDLYCFLPEHIKCNDSLLDLGVFASVLSCCLKKVPRANRAYIGEISLSGSIKCENNISSHLKELEASGIESMITTQEVCNSYKEKTKLNLIPIKNLGELSELL